MSAKGPHLLHEHWSHPDNARCGGGGSSLQTLPETEKLRRSHNQAGRCLDTVCVCCLCISRLQRRCHTQCHQLHLGLARRAQRAAKG